MRVFSDAKIGVALALVLASPALAEPVRLCGSLSIGGGGPVSFSVTADDAVERIDAPLSEGGGGMVRSRVQDEAFAALLPLFEDQSSWYDIPQDQWDNVLGGYCAFGLRLVLIVEDDDGVAMARESACPSPELFGVFHGFAGALGSACGV